MNTVYTIIEETEPGVWGRSPDNDLWSNILAAEAVCRALRDAYPGRRFEVAEITGIKKG